MTQTVSLETIYQPIEAQLNGVVDAILEILVTPNELVQEVIRYFFSSRGKLLRPALTFLGSQLHTPVSVNERELVRLGAALEIFHSATLIHDDIVDAAGMRRNLPTIHEKWSPQVAVLAGDYFHQKALSTVFAAGSHEILSFFLKTTAAVCDGEIRECKERKNMNLKEKDYLDIVAQKTASLLQCAVVSGAALAGSSPGEKEALSRFGNYFGIAFQIVDDCLDFMGNENEFGKTLGADCSAGVLTLPLIYLFSVVKSRERAHAKEILNSDMTPENFRQILDWLHEYGALDYALKKGRDYSDKAREELKVFKDTPAKRSLELLLDYVLDRSR